MSLVIIIDPKTGEIVDELHAFSSYRSPKGITVKPKTLEEELRLRKISENAVKIRKMKEEIEQLDKEYMQLQMDHDLDAMEERRRRRQKLAEEVQRKENFSQAVQTIHRLQERMAELEHIVISVPTSEGSEEVTLALEEYTDKAYSKLAERLERLNEAFHSDEPALVKCTMQSLVQIEEAMEALPDQAQKAYTRMIVRMELAQNVMDRLNAAGWGISVEEEGSASIATRITAKNAIGNHASLVFACGDQIILETPGFTESARSALQQLVLGTLRESGATKAVGKCLEDQPPQPPQGTHQMSATQGDTDKERLYL